MDKKFFLLVVLVSVLLSSCSLSTAVPATQNVPTLVVETLPPGVVVEIQNRVSETLGVPADQLQIDTVEQTDWPDSCLGLPEQDEACAEVITPGWLVVVDIAGTKYSYRVDESGTNIRQES